MSHFWGPALVLIAGTMSSSLGLADVPTFAPDGVAIGGYDPVAYFTDERATEGQSAHSYVWRGVEWRFRSEKHRDLFMQSPESYAPAFGGFCALGVAHGALVPSNPEAWTLHDGKLILNQADAVSTTWRYNPDINLRRAEDSYASALQWYAKWQERAAKQQQTKGIAQ